MNPSQKLETWFSLIDVFPPEDSKHFRDGARSIKHTPKHAPQAYFHRLFAPCDAADIEGLERQLDCELDSDYKALMMFSNGLHLFASRLCLYGFSSERLVNRTVDTEVSRPIYIRQSATYFPLMQPQLYADGWRAIGGFHGYADQYSLILHQSGRTKYIADDFASAEFDALFDFLTAAAHFYGTFFKDGEPLRDTDATIDKRLREIRPVTLQ